MDEKSHHADLQPRMLLKRPFGRFRRWNRYGIYFKGERLLTKLLLIQYMYLMLAKFSF